jgi:hypothetical protein
MPTDIRESGEVGVGADHLKTMRRNAVIDIQGIPTRRGPFNAASIHALESS